MIRYLFRVPVFPVICDVEDVLIGAKSRRQLNSKLSALNLLPENEYPVVDATGEGWVLHTKHMVVSPLTLKKRWTKAEIVRMFNDSPNARQSDLRYPEKSLGNRRLDRIVGEIVEMISITNKRNRPKTGRGSAKADSKEVK